MAEALTARGTISILAYSALMEEWDWERNGDLDPAQVPRSWTEKVGWKCEKDHRWQAAPKKRTRRDKPTGCPYCAGRAVDETNCLATTHPHLAAEWDLERNHPLTPQDVTAGSGKKAGWICPSGHRYEAFVYSRSDGAGCPYEAGKRVDETNCLATTHPELLKEWDYERNETLGLSPHALTAGAATRAHWHCDVHPSHCWEASLNNRTKPNGTGCPYCAGQRVAPDNCLQACYPQIAAQWHPTLNGDKTPEDVMPGNSEMVWWQCRRDPRHVWDASPQSRCFGGSGCLYCSGWRVNETNSLAALLPDLAAQWHPTKNGDKTPEKVTTGHSGKAWWVCPDYPTHEWEARVAARTRGSGCPYCARRRVDATNSLAALFPDVAAEWHPTLNGEKTPDVIAPGHALPVWWQCGVKESHVWEALPGNRTRLGNGCPYCSGRMADDENSLQALYPEIAAQWHPSKNDGLDLSRVAPCSNVKAWWRCPVDSRHEWESYVYSRTNGSGCPQCKGWPIEKVRVLVASLGPLLEMDADERDQLLEREGLLTSYGRSRAIIEAIRADLIEVETLQAFLAGELDAQGLVLGLLRTPAVSRRMRRQTVHPALRNRIYARDGHRCQGCDAHVTRGDIDHFVPWALGGPTLEENLWTLCEKCNGRKWMHFPDDGWVARRTLSGRELPSTYFLVADELDSCASRSSNGLRN